MSEEAEIQEIQTETGTEVVSDAGPAATADSAAPEAAAEGEVSSFSPPSAQISSEDEQEKETHKPDRRDKRIAKLTARLREAEARAQAPAAELNPTEDFNRRVQQAAAQQISQNEFNRQCNETVKHGQEEFGKAEFDARLAALRSTIDESDPEETQNYWNFINMGLETGSLHQIIYKLGGDLDEASRILDLSPAKQAVALAKLSIDGVKAPAEDSKAPKPIRALGGGRESHAQTDPTDKSRSDTLSTQEWMRRREEQVYATRRR